MNEWLQAHQYLLWLLMIWLLYRVEILIRALIDPGSRESAKQAKRATAPGAGLDYRLPKKSSKWQWILLVAVIGVAIELLWLLFKGPN